MFYGRYNVDLGEQKEDEIDVASFNRRIRCLSLLNRETSRQGHHKYLILPQSRNAELCGEGVCRPGETLTHLIRFLTFECDLLGSWKPIEENRELSQ